MPPQRQRQNHLDVLGVGREVQWRRAVGGAVEGEGGAIGHHAAGMGERQLAQFEQLCIQFQFQEPPEGSPQATAALFEVVLEVALPLLEMLWAQVHPLGPQGTQRMRQRGG
ncbi:hypothetical protein D3C78_1450120 [compost metagenome]